MTGHLIVTDEDATRVITLRRPEKKNAITQDMYRAMSDAIDTAQNNPAIRCIIITGGSGVFTAGNDLEDFLHDGTSNTDTPRASNATKFLYSLAHNVKPIIAAVDGVAIGIGTTMLFHCDYVLASKTATFSTPFIHLGLVPEGASSLLMPRTMGHQRAFATAGDGAHGQRRRCAPRRLRQRRGGARPYRSRGPQGGARDLRAAGGSGRDLAQAAETAAGRSDPPDRPGEPSVRRTHALQGSGGRLQGVLCAQEVITPSPAPTIDVDMSQPLAPVLIVLLALSCPATPSAAETAAPVDVRILAINDFHGNLRPPPGGIRIADPDDKTKKIAVPAGGAEHMATLVQQLRRGHNNTIFVAAGDLIGASPFLSAMFHDEPTIESLSMMGLAISSVGNHEFDEGKDELLRMQNGGCHPTDGCQGPHPFPGAKFHYLAASTIEKATGKTVFPPYEIREFDGIPVAFIGLTLKGTPSIVSPVGVAGLEFRDEADTVNALVPELKARGVEAIVVLIHEGGYPTGDYNECPGISGAIVDIVKKFDRAVDVVISGHTHQAYVCEIDGRLVTSGDKYGTIVTAIDLKLDRDDPRRRQRQGRQCHRPHRRLCQGSANRPRCLNPTTNLPPRSPTARRARSPRRCRTAPNDAGESALGDIIADAQLAATSADANGGAVIAFTNPGGIRTDIAKKAGWRGDLRRPVRQPAVPEPAGHADADGNADQGRAGAAMARPEAAADSAGLEGVRLCLGRRQALWRPRDRRPDVAERPADRSRDAATA